MRAFYKEALAWLGLSAAVAGILFLLAWATVFPSIGLLWLAGLI
jgi:hypothetical protein